MNREWEKNVQARNIQPRKFGFRLAALLLLLVFAFGTAGVTLGKYMQAALI